MKIGSLFKTAVLSLSAISATSCGRGPLHRVKEPSQVVHTIDSLKKVTQKTLIDKSYQSFGKDTIELSKNLEQTSGKLINKLNDLAQSSSPSVKTGTCETMVPTYDVNLDIMTLTSQTNDVFTENFINSKAVIGDGIFASKNGKKLYIPVEYYGQPNPELAK